MSYANRVGTTILDGPQVDAFGRLRISEPTTLFDYTAQYNSGTSVRWAEQTATGGSSSHLPNESAVQLSVTSSTGSKVIRQTRQYFRYQPGRSQVVIMSFVLGALKAGTRQRVGYFDANNGILLEQTGTVRNLVRRSSTSGSVVNDAVAQADWNVDKMDGTGASGITLDFSKTQIMIIDLQWLGVGRVRIGFDVDGQLYYAHQFLNANNLTVPYMSTANLPVRYELETTGSPGTSTTLKAICVAVMSETGFDFSRALHFTANRGITPQAVTTRRPILSIRSKATFNSLQNTIIAYLHEMTVTATSNDALIELVTGGTLTGASYSDVNTNECSIEYDVSASAISGGITLDSFYIVSGSAANRLVTEYQVRDFTNAILYETLNSVASPMSIVATSLNATANLTAAINWIEIR
jgi:hypothetical protein